MTTPGFRRPAALIAAIVLILGVAGPAAALDPETAFYVARPNHGAIAQIADLRSSGQHAEAELIRDLIRTPTAEWYTQGTPRGVMQDVRNDVNRAADKGVIPVLVAYNIPFRDCAQFSAGGATTAEEYEAWIDGFAAGIGDLPAIVILEPDGLGIIPWYNPFADRDTWVAPGTLEWCQPAEADAATAASDRFAMLNYAVDALKANPNARVYLDGTHSAWLGSGDAADRLIQAGVGDADGFFVNVSNYRLDAHLAKYGTWTAKCIAFASNPASWGLGHSEWCASQYSPANPSDFSTWGLTDQWYVDNVESQTWWYSESVLEHFVVDTSRNGQGPWTPPAYPDPQDWCNPPGRGVGVRPTADTGNALIDAYLWVKVPGESDGECTRGLGPGGSTVDPEWGRIDPPAGAWFPEQALELAELAVPAFGD
jgi:endoglucanase